MLKAKQAYRQGYPGIKKAGKNFYKVRLATGRWATVPETQPLRYRGKGKWSRVTGLDWKNRRGK